MEVFEVFSSALTLFLAKFHERACASKASASDGPVKGSLSQL